MHSRPVRCETHSSSHVRMFAKWISSSAVVAAAPANVRAVAQSRPIRLHVCVSQTYVVFAVKREHHHANVRARTTTFNVNKIC